MKAFHPLFAYNIYLLIWLINIANPTLSSLMVHGNEGIISISSQTPPRAKLVVTIQIQNANESMNSENTTLTSGLYDRTKFIFHHTCFGHIGTRANEIDKERIIDYCCHKSILNLTYCHRSIAKVPLLEQDAATNNNTMIPMFYISTVEDRDYLKAVFHDVVRSSDKEMKDSVEWRLFSNVLSSFDTDNETTAVYTQIDSLLEKSCSPFQNSKHFAIVPNKNKDTPTFSASLDTNIDFQAGMHRPYNHNLMISVPSMASNGITNSLSIDGNMTLLLPIHSEYFLDLDDPFQDDISQACKIQMIVDGHNELLLINDEVVSRCQIEVVTSSNSVIDIEQPSFASTEHVVAFHINYNVDISENSWKKFLDMTTPSSLSLALNFVPVMHLRYQPPIIDIAKKVIYLGVQNSFLYSGSMHTTVEFDDNKYEKKSYVMITDACEQNSNLSVHMVEVACGLDRHYNFVMIATIAACIIGTIQMIRDLSKIGHWY